MKLSFALIALFVSSITTLRTDSSFDLPPDFKASLAAIQGALPKEPDFTAQPNPLAAFMQPQHGQRASKTRRQPKARAQNAQAPGLGNFLAGLERKPNIDTKFASRDPRNQQSIVYAKELRGSIKIDGDNSKLPRFKMYFDGIETTNNNDGFFQFPIESGMLQNCGIIICNKIKHDFGKHNTVVSFGLIPDMNYRYFRYTNQGPKGGEWIEESKDLNKGHLQIPPNTVVLTLNPAYFDRIEPEWPGNFDAESFKLPRLVLKSGQRKKIDRKAVKSLLYSFEMSPFHTQVKHAHKDIGEGKGDILIPHEN